MNDERSVFEEAIKTNPRDFTARKIYADWLDEHDEPELADKHRGWNDEKQDAWEWLEDCAHRCSGEKRWYGIIPGEDLDDEANWIEHEEKVTVEELITSALQYLKDGTPFWLPMNTEGIGSDSNEEFWPSIELVTGQKYVEPHERDDDDWGEDAGFLRCAC